MILWQKSKQTRQHTLTFPPVQSLDDTTACKLIYLQTCAMPSNRFIYFMQSNQSKIFWGWDPGDLWPWNSNSAEIFWQCTYPWSFIILRLIVRKLSCKEMNVHTNKQTNTQRCCWKHPYCFAMLCQWRTKMKCSNIPNSANYCFTTTTITSPPKVIWEERIPLAQQRNKVCLQFLQCDAPAGCR